MSKLRDSFLRQKENILQKIGKSKQTKDEEFEQISSEFNNHEIEMKRLFNSAQQFFQALKTLENTAKTLSNEIEGFYSNSKITNQTIPSKIAGNFSAIMDSIEELNNEHMEVIRPINSQIKYIEETKQKFQVRKKNQLQLDVLKKKMEKIEEKKEKKPEAISEIENKLQKAELDFVQINDDCKQNIRKIFQNKHEAMNIPLISLLRGQEAMLSSFKSTPFTPFYFAKSQQNQNQNQNQNLNQNLNQNQNYLLTEKPKNFDKEIEDEKENNEK